MLINNGQLTQRVANRARALLALDLGERIDEIVFWLGISRTSLWELWQRSTRYRDDHANSQRIKK